MALLLSLPLLGGLMMFQSAILSQVRLLHGTPDLVLLAVVAWAVHERTRSAWFWGLVGGIFYSLASALPFGVMLAGYLAATALALVLKRQVWKLPVLIMFVATFAGTLITHGLSYASLAAGGVVLPVFDSLNLVTLPSLILNILLAGPMYIFIGDLASWLYPEPLEL